MKSITAGPTFGYAPRTSATKLFVLDFIESTSASLQRRRSVRQPVAIVSTIKPAANRAVLRRGERLHENPGPPKRREEHDVFRSQALIFLMSSDDGGHPYQIIGWTANKYEKPFASTRDQTNKRIEDYHLMLFCSRIISERVDSVFRWLRLKSGMPLEPDLYRPAHR